MTTRTVIPKPTSSACRGHRAHAQRGAGPPRRPVRVRPGRGGTDVAARTTTRAAAADVVNGYGVRLAQAWWAGAFAFMDAIAVLSEPPACWSTTFVVPIPEVASRARHDRHPDTLRPGAGRSTPSRRTSRSPSLRPTDVRSPTILAAGTEHGPLPGDAPSCWSRRGRSTSDDHPDQRRAGRPPSTCPLDLTTEVP